MSKELYDMYKKGCDIKSYKKTSLANKIYKFYVTLKDDERILFLFGLNDEMRETILSLSIAYDSE